MRILLSYGTRPEWIKIKPLVEAFKNNNIEYECLFTGQHTDLLSTQIFDYEIKIQQTESNRLNNIISSILLNPFKSIDYHKLCLTQIYNYQIKNLLLK